MSDAYNGFVAPTREEKDPFAGFESPRVLPNAIGNIGADGNTAGKSLNLSKKSGVPGVVIDADLPGFEQDYNTQQAGKIVQANSVIQNYLETDPLHAKISHDDYEHLDKVTQTAKEATHDSMLSQLGREGEREGGLLQTIPQFLHMIGSPEGQSALWSALKNYPAEFVKGMLDQVELPGNIASGKIDINSEEGLEQALGLGTLIGLGRLNKLPTTGKTSGALPPKTIRPETEAMLQKNEIPPPGFDPIVDEIHTKQAELDSVNLDRLINQREKSTTFARSVDAFEDFINKATTPVESQIQGLDNVRILPKDTPNIVRGQNFNLTHGEEVADSRATFIKEYDELARIRAEKVEAEDKAAARAHLRVVPEGAKTIGIPADAITKLYASEKTVPGPDDGLLGWIPDLESKVRSAQLTGGDVEVSLGSYAARVDSSVHTKLKDSLRFREDGISVAEGQELKEAVKAREEKIVQEGETETPIVKSEVSAEPPSDIPLSELKALAKENEMEFPFSDDQLNDLVRGKFEQTDIATASDLKKFQRDVASAGRQVEQALLKGKTDEALKWKQRQVLASKFAKEATKLQSEMTKAEKQFDRFNDNQKVNGVDQNYTNQIHQILEQFGWPSKRNSGTPTRQISSVKLEDFVNNKIANGTEMPVADFLFDQSFLKAYDDLTVEEFRAIADSVATIAHNGREAEKITVGAKKQDYKQTVAEALNQISDVDSKIMDRHPGKLDIAASWIKAVDASLLKMEQMLRWLDKRDKFGIFTQTVMRPIEVSKHFKDDMLKDLGKKIKTFEQDKTWMKSLEDKVDNQFLLDWQSGEPRNITRGDLVAIMLHMGNESNFKKLTAPFDYNGQRFQWNRDIVQALVDVNARKADWDFVQHIWDIHESYWPQIEDLAKRMSGVVPDRIEARSITNEHGSFKGGYMPLDADALWPGTKPNEKGLFNAERYFNSIPPKGYTKARTNAAYPLELNFNKIIETMRQTIHDLAYRESLTNAAKFLDNTEIRGGIQRFFGPEYLAQVRPWLEDIAGNSKRVDDRSLGALNSVARIARERTVTVQMMYRLMTAFKHGAAAGLYSVGEVGSTVVPEMLKLFGTENGRARIAEIYKESGEIRNRLHNSDRDIGDALDQVVGKSGIQQWLVQNGGIATAALDLGTAIPTYEVAYKKALKEGMSKEDAVYAGESAVRDAHGSAGQPDLAAIMRGNEWIKLGTVAFGTFNHNYGRIRDAARLTREGVSDLKEGETSKAFDKFSTAAWRMSWYLVLTAIAEEAIAPIPTKDGEHEGFAKWAAKGIGAQLAGTIPFVRDAVRGWMYGRNDPTPTPISQIESTIAGTAKDIYQGKVTSKGDKARHAIESTGYVLGIPGTGQLGVTTKFLMDLNAGTQKAENPYRFGRGLVSGRSHPEKLR